jgi:hypothetical protein
MHSKLWWLLKIDYRSHSFAIMSLHLIKRLMFVLAAFTILNGGMATPTRVIAAQTGVIAATASDDCLAMKMDLQCQVAKSGPCKMAASDCAKMMMCCDGLSGAMMFPAAPVESLGYTPISYHDISVALRGRTVELIFSPPKAA